MRGRIPVILSVTALIVALLGSTPLGEAARRVVPFARNADRVDGIHASRTPQAGKLLALNRARQFPTSVMPGLTTTLHTRETSSSSEQVKSVDVSCPGSQIATGGGASVSNPVAALTQSVPATVSTPVIGQPAPDPTPNSGWSATAVSPVNATWKLTVYVLCTRAVQPIR